MKKIILSFIFFFACIISIKAQTLYGLTGEGGNDGVGTFIKFIPATNNLTVAKSFENYAANPVYTNFIQASDGKLYGMTSYGGYNTSSNGYTLGTIFSFDPSTSTYTKLKNFDGTDGNHPSGSLMQASNGKLYGMTPYGGSYNYGVIFSFDPVSSAYTKLIDFDSTNGANPYGSLIQASDGKLYGMTSTGGSIDRGVIFFYDPASSTYTKLKDFDGYNGAGPFGSLMQASNGKLYGMTSAGGSSNGGVIFSFDPTTSVYTMLKDFGNPNPYSDGVNPSGSLIQASNGKLYGMTPYGGINGGNGVIFSFDPVTSTYTKLMNFNIAGNPNGPQGSLMQASNGKLYGMISGASYNSGAIFSFDPTTSVYTMLKDFNNAGGSDGANPRGSLMQASNGKLYGMTSYGGAGNGVIFSFDPSSSTYTKLKNFDAPDGRTPIGSLVYASNGKLYGMTYDGGGGSSDLGVIFSYDLSSSAYTKLMDFDGDGGIHYGSLMQASNGKLYGMRSGIGGDNSSGVIFSFDPTSSTYTKLKRFDYINGSFPDGTDPEGSLIQASDGKLYGMTSQGGSGNYGVIFSFDPLSSTFTKLKDFYYANGSYPDGSYPGGNLVQASNGKLYGMTAHGGSGYDPGNYYGSGVIFSFDPSSSLYTKLMDFDSTNGADPRSSLIQASDGKLYGMTAHGGSNNSGVVFSYDPSSSTYTKLKDFGGANGAEPWGSLMQASDGKLYGMTNRGGSNNSGVVFSLDPSTSIFTKLKDLDSTNSAYPLFGSAFTEVSNIASVSIGITAGVNPTCTGQSITFTATPTNGGSSPTYQWKVNGNNVGTNSSIYTTNTLTNGQVVSCVMTSSNPNPATVTSNQVTMVINTFVTPAASIAITSGANPACAGQAVTLTATPTNGGNAPTYQWKVDGSNVGTNSATYSSTTLTNGQVVSCIMTSSLACVTSSTATSNNITMTVNSAVTPSANIAITTGTNPVCTGQSIGFTVTPTNGGSAPTYQWKVNGNNVGTNSATYSSTTLTNGQVVSCVMTSDLACASPITATSNNITIAISPVMVPSISISQSYCNGSTVGFTSSITNGGNNPSYLWSFTGSGTATNFSGPNFTLTNATNGSQVQCTFTSNAACASPVQVTSTPLTVTCIGSGVVSPANLNLQIHPNPANQNTVITFYLGASVRISLDAFNMLGQQIKIFEDGVLNSGNQTIPWNTEKLAAGVYFIRLRTVNYSTAKKVVVLH